MTTMTEAPAQVKVMVVDDLDEKLLVYRAILEEPGIDVVTVRSGEEALGRLLRDEFAVILLDVNMPGMDGFETASMIRQRRRCAHTPIIFITGHADDMYALRGYSHGAVDYMMAPVVPAILRTKVRVFVELSRLTQQVRRQAATQVADIERERAHLMDVLESAAECVATIGVDGTLRRMNSAGKEMLGYAAGGHEFPKRWEQVQPGWAWDQTRDIVIPAVRKDGVWFGESALRRASGEEVPVSVVALADHSAHGATERFSWVAHDISARRRIEHELETHRKHLEQLVEERTNELTKSHERLRLSDRLAAIGTLAAGLGHDMGNLLLPVSMRLQALNSIALPAEAKDDLRAIGEACDYLKNLTRGLRMFAQNPDERSGADLTVVSKWWTEVHPFFKSVIPRGVRFAHNVPSSVPDAAIAPHVLTQAVFNLVQNAADALRVRGTGEVHLRVAQRDGAVNFEITDDGPGMAPEVAARCLEPFFTTKARTMSTGLGLALVHGAVKAAGGSVEVITSPGNGTTFRLTIPTSVTPTPHRASTISTGRVCVEDPRVSAFASAMFQNAGIQPVAGAWSRSSPERLLLIDAPEQWDELAAFLSSGADRRAIVLGGNPPRELNEKLILIEQRPSASTLRAAIMSTRPSTAKECV